ncbi:sodium:calcium exchanger, partial [Cronbergia sp. UHCC 0137]|nr:sodium:calcium exchanger [Cronbergia sp. UHCC 0137]
MTFNLLNNGLITDELYLTLFSVLQQVELRLRDFANGEEFIEKMRSAFGDTFDPEAALNLANAWKNQDFSIIPTITLLSSAELNGANGAYGASTNTIYLSAEFVRDNQHCLVDVVLEELGHRIDSLLNQTDSAGDEGAIFAALVLGVSLSVEDLQLLRAEDDRTVIILDGQSIAIEQQNFTGTAGNDTIVGTSGDDVINGLGGNDSLNGLEGNDTINSGLGTDTVNGGDGDDLLIVDYSNNTYSIWPGYNITTSITANSAGSHSGYYASPYGYTTGYIYDIVYFSNIERFNITGTIVDDYITTGNGNDLIDGRGGNDVINAGGGNDTVNGGQGDDNISGQDGNDYLRGEEGNDTIDGGAGNDVIEGGLGNDVITKGSGIDTV